jgi:hypothetical protein
MYKASNFSKTGDNLAPLSYLQAEGALAAVERRISDEILDRIDDALEQRRLAEFRFEHGEKMNSPTERRDYFRQKQGKRRGQGTFLRNLFEK